MNAGNDCSASPTPSPVPPPLPEANPDAGPEIQGSLLAALLKSPAQIMKNIEADEALWRRGALLWWWGLVFHAGFGFTLGLFGGWAAALMALGKAPLIAVCSLVLCLPSLYVFSSVGGMPLTLSQTFALSGGALAMTGILLVGLAPVTWLFSVSTKSVGFIVVLNLFVWIIAIGFATRFLDQLRVTTRLGRTLGLKWWLAVYLLVTLQMVTTLRPLLEKPASGWWVAGKKFFLIYFGEQF